MSSSSLPGLTRRALPPSSSRSAPCTLTALYNERPTWLAHAHARLDRAVWAAYAWPDPDPAAVPEDLILERLLALNGERSR